MSDKTRKIYENNFKNHNLKVQKVAKVRSEQSTGRPWQAKLERKALIKLELSRSKQ